MKTTSDPSPAGPTPYPLSINGLYNSVAPDFKLVQVRGGATINTSTGSGGSGYFNVAQPALPGDRKRVQLLLALARSRTRVRRPASSNDGIQDS